MMTHQKNLVPRAEEGLLEATWFPIDEAIKTLAYDTDQDIVNRAREQLLGKITAVPRPTRSSSRRLRIHT